MYARNENFVVCILCFSIQYVFIYLCSSSVRCSDAVDATRTEIIAAPTAFIYLNTCFCREGSGVTCWMGGHTHHFSTIVIPNHLNC